MMDGSCLTRDTRHTGSCNTHFGLLSSLSVHFRLLGLEVYRAYNLNEFQGVRSKIVEEKLDLIMVKFFKQKGGK